MPEFQLTETDAVHYLYQERTCSMDPKDIGENMGIVFHAVMAFMTEQDITPAGAPVSIYHTYSPDSMTFQAGFIVTPADAEKASGDVKAGMIPPGKTLAFTHVGPYARLRDSYGEMMEYVEAEGLTLAAPTWEVYVDDPSAVPEDKLRTEVFSRLA